MNHTDYWLGLMQRLAQEVRSLSAAPMREGERKLCCTQCDYVLLTSGSARQFCPNGCGELRADTASEE
jgi:hypothetical protein